MPLENNVFLVAVASLVNLLVSQFGSKAVRFLQMSVEQIEASLLQLPQEERRRFLKWFYEHEHDFMGNEIDPEVRQEILARRDEAIAHPESLERWEGTTDRVRARLNEIRRQKNTAR